MDACVRLSICMTSSPSESHFFKTVSQEVCPSDGRSRHIAADGRRACEGTRRCQAVSFPSPPPAAGFKGEAPVDADACFRF